jgi:hypothetical protein
MAKEPTVKIIKVGIIYQEASEMASTYNLQLKAELCIGGGSTVILVQSEKNPEKQKPERTQKTRNNGWFSFFA